MPQIPGVPKNPAVPTTLNVPAAPVAAAPTMMAAPATVAGPGPLLRPPPPDVREFDDIPKLRGAIETRVIDALRNLPARRVGKHSLLLTDVDWTGPESFTPAQHKDAILRGQSLGRRIKGVWRLKDEETGEEVATRKTLVAQLPWLTPLGTIPFRGNDYTVGHQLRLLPGAYSRRKKNGELETHVNVLPGNGLSHRYFLEPETSKFNVRIRQAKTPLFPLLKALGASDQEIEEAWGPELYAINRKEGNVQNLKQVYTRLARRPDPAAGPEVMADTLKTELERMRLDPDVSQATLGKPYERLDKDAVLAATRRLLAIHRNEEEVDDRDHPAFQRIVGPEDLFSERITHDYGRVQQGILRRAALTRNLDFVPAGALSRQLDAVLLHSGLAMTGEEINPTEILDKITRVSRMGEGGLPSLSSIPDEARAVNAGQFGMLDPVRTPECVSAEHEVMTADGWKPWPQVTKDDKLACMVDGRLEFHPPLRLIDEEYSGPLCSLATGPFRFRMTPNHRLWLRSWKKEWRFYLAGSVWGEELAFSVSVDPNSATPDGSVKSGLGQLWTDQITLEKYEGRVYCAEVPGGLLFMRLPGSAGFWSGNSLRAGVDIYASRGARKGADGRLYATLRNLKTGEDELKSPRDLREKTVAFPGEMRRFQALPEEERAGAWIRGIKDGQEDFIKPDEAEYELAEFEDAFSKMGNLIPFKSASQPQRMSMGSRFLTQALPLTNPEAPLVQGGALSGKGRSFESAYGQFAGSAMADKAGVVVDVKPGEAMTVRYEDGTTGSHPLYTDFPYNRKSVSGASVVTIRRDGKIWRGPIAEYEWRPGDRTRTLDPETQEAGWLEVTGCLRHVNDKRLLRITTESGRQVVVTEDHSLVTMSASGEIVPILPEDLIVNGTRLPVCLMADESEAGSRQDYLEGCLAGLYLAEGDLPEQAGLVRIAALPESWQEQILALCQELGIAAYRTTGRVQFTDHARRTDLLGLFNRIAHQKTCRAEVLDRSRAYRVGLLNGYLSGDGNLWEDTNGAIQLTGVSCSREARDGLVDALASLGVFCTLFDAPRAHLSDKWHDAYGFRILSSHLERMERWFFYDDRQQKFARLVRKSYRASPFELLPCQDKAARRALYREVKDEDGKVSTYLYKTAHLGRVAKWRVQHCRGPYGAWARSSTVWDLVVSIEPAPHEAEVYDLSVAKAETFSVNTGLVVHNSGLTMTPMLAPGERFQPGQTLVKSNFTNDRGELALGLNLRTGYLPFKGHNYEDAIVVSESAAKKLSSEHMYQHRHDVDPQYDTGRAKFLGLYPREYDRRQLDQVDSDGVVRPGTEVQPGDPLILAVKKMIDPSGRLHKKSSSTWQPAATTWEHQHPGIVTDVVKDKDGISVVVKSHSELQVADKLSGRYGDKGVVAAIIPDDQMPRDEQGRPLEVAMNELGVISRANASQVAEAVLGKIAADKLGGKPFVINDFEDIDDVSEWAEQQAREHGVKVREDLEDPETGAKIPGVLTGNRFVMKLHHIAESKSASRGIGGYTGEEAPAKGGGPSGGSKRVSLLNVNALLSHGAVGVMRDASLVRGQKNSGYWLDYMSGRTPREPEVPFVYRKFLAELQAGGVNVVPEGTQLHIMALLDKDVDELAGGREIVNRESGRMVNQEFVPTTGGLFDPKLTGADGEKWARISFPEPIPNPVMEEPIRRILGLTAKGLEEVIQGTKKLPSGDTGPKGIQQALSAINVPKELALTRLELKRARGTRRDDLVRRLDYLKSAQRLDIHPRDWMLTKAPVLPPRFRPVAIMEQSGLPLVNDANFLYRELLEARDNLKTMGEKSSDVGEERLALYQAMKAVTGLGDPLHPKLRDKGVSGILKHVFSHSPKTSVLQQKLVGSTVDLVGRGVIVPNPDLDMDSIGIPETKAWDIYRMHMVRRLKSRGMPLGRAMEEVEKRTPLAREEMIKEMESRPIMMDRAPVLHRFGEMAFWPRLTNDEAVHVSPLVIQGFGADFDGDAVQYHVPGTDEAAREMAERMLPSRNLISPADFKRPMHVPIREYALGLYLASKKVDPKARADFYEDEDAVIRAFRRGELNPDSPVELPDARK